MTQPVNIPGVPAMYEVRWLDLIRTGLNAVGSRNATESSVPVTGFSHQIPNATGTCLFQPAGGLATGTVVLPAKAVDGFEQHIVSTRTVTTLTVAPSTGQTILGVTTVTLTAYSELVYRFLAANSTWYQVR